MLSARVVAVAAAPALPWVFCGSLRLPTTKTTLRSVSHVSIGFSSRISSEFLIITNDYRLQHRTGSCADRCEVTSPDHAMARFCIVSVVKGFLMLLPTPVWL